MARRIEDEQTVPTMEQTLFMAEVSEWFDWMELQTSSGLLLRPDEETCVLIIVEAIYQVDELEPTCFIFVRRSVRDQLITALIVFQYDAKVPSSWQWQGGVQMALPDME